MSEMLLVDFGASRIKCAVWSIESNAVVDEAQTPSPEPVFGPNGEVEIAPEQYWSALETTAGRMATKHPAALTLWLCVEMHGIIVADLDGKPLTNYISWRDGRAARAVGTQKSVIDKLEDNAARFLALSGMKLRAGLPILSLACLAGQRLLPPAMRLFTLADWLLWRGGERSPAIHASLAAGTGFYDPKQKIWSETLYDLGGLADRKVTVARIAGTGEQIGRIELGGRRLTVFGGLGDLQAAIAGTGFPTRARMAVNLGTGSQVVRQADVIPPGIERRPGTDDTEFAVITHIPSGRALNVFAALLDGAAKAGGGQPFFWQKFSVLSASDILDSTLVVEMNVFEAASGYRDGGTIARIHENHFSPEDLMAAVAKAWLLQYARAMRALDPGSEEKFFLLSGGLSRRAEFVAPVLQKLCNRIAIPSKTVTEEETLDGLLAMALEYK